MKLEIKVPSVGESVTEADIGSWEKQTGDFVKKGDVLLVLETDKASMEIPAEQAGVLEILKKQGEKVQVGEVLGLIDTKASAPTSSPSKISASQKEEPVSSLKSISKPSESSFLGKEDLSPAVRRLVETHQIPVSEVQGTGRGGRLTKEDILKALNEVPSTSSVSQKSESVSRTDSSKGQRREPMTRLRRVTAERLVHSQQSTATLSTFNEVDLSRIIEIRKNYQETFVKKYGYKLGFMSFFVKAVVSALKAYPRINAFIEGTDIIYNDHQHVGIAVGTDKGLVVPVIFHAEELSLSEIEKKILDYKDKALNRKLTPDDLIGGTFTISNGGVFGSLLSTPILNPPQSGILGMHKIEERPVVRKGRVEIRPMMYLTLSYDHRMVDGRESVGFLVKVKEDLEEPARLLIDF